MVFCYSIVASACQVKRIITSAKTFVAPEPNLTVTATQIRHHYFFRDVVYGIGCLGKMMSTLDDVQQMTSPQVNVFPSRCLHCISYTSLNGHFWPARSSCYFHTSFSKVLSTMSSSSQVLQKAKDYLYNIVKKRERLLIQEKIVLIQ